MLRALFRNCINFILPPRRTQGLVDALQLRDLEQLQTTIGLPYHAEEVQALVWELKYYGNKRAAALAGEFLAEDLLSLAAEELGRPLLIPVPMHAARLRERGHNHTELLCEATLKALGKSGGKNSLVDVPEEGRPEDFFDSTFAYAPNALKRILHIPHQQGLERQKRLHNVKNSMQADKKLVAGRVCVVVDYVTTTGATLAEAARALKAAGALRVHCLALAQS